MSSMTARSLRACAIASTRPRWDSGAPGHEPGPGMNSSRPHTTEPVSIAGAVVPLEGVIEDPSPDAAPAAFMVICHPHPLHGGTMGNKVVTTLARTAQGMGVPTLRFNFRGVGASAGSFDEGRG